MSCTSRYFYSSCTIPAVNCFLYYDRYATQPVVSGIVKMLVNSQSHRYETSSIGQITVDSVCVFNASTTYSAFYSGIKNDCPAGSCTIYPSTVNLNDGNPANAYSTSGSYTSYISQADADAQAFSIAYNAFEAGKQAKVNQLGTCAYSYANGSATFPATYYTKNNCATNCDPSSVQYPAVTKTNYYRESTISCADAISLANAAAYSAAQSESNYQGQLYANANGTCCCWTSAAYCDGCNYYGSREVNCVGTYRNSGVTDNAACNCNQNCKGTYYGNNYCSGADGKNRTYYEIYNCNGASTGASYTVNCGCNDGQTDRQDTGTTTCIGCSNIPIYRDMNRCSSTPYHYFVNGVDYGTNSPSTASCWTGTDYSAYKGVRCYSGTNYDVYEDTNHTCSQQWIYQLRDSSGAAVDYSNSLGNPACQFSAYRSANFTRNNCPSGYTAGTVWYSNTYYYTGILNQAGADYVADSNFNTDGQNYANANGSCTAPVSCYTYNIISNNTGVYVTGNYTTCEGIASSFSIYSSSAYTAVGTVCAKQGSISGMSNGSAVSSGNTC